MPNISRRIYSHHPDLVLISCDRGPPSSHRVLTHCPLYHLTCVYTLDILLRVSCPCLLRSLAPHRRRTCHVITKRGVLEETLPRPNEGIAQSNRTHGHKTGYCPTTDRSRPQGLMVYRSLRFCTRSVFMPRCDDTTLGTKGLCQQYGGMNVLSPIQKIILRRKVLAFYLHISSYQSNGTAQSSGSGCGCFRRAGSESVQGHGESLTTFLTSHSLMRVINL